MLFFNRGFNMNIKTILPALLLQSSICLADVAVIVHPSNSNTIEKSNIARIFLGKVKRFPDGKQVVPLNQNSKHKSSAEFNKKVLKKSPSQFKGYWSKLVFSGKGTPPKSVASDADMIDLIAANPNMIGYISATAVTDNVKVIGTF